MSRRNGPALALLADLTRRRIIALLAMRPSRPSTVANLVPLSRSAATRHLRLLEEAGIVVAQPLMLDGRAILYKLNPLARGAIAAFLAGTDLGLSTADQWRWRLQARPMGRRRRVEGDDLVDGRG